jgi:DNA-binding GntR family transcriptional regulator
LERQTVTLASQPTSPANCAALKANLVQMSEAISRNDRTAYVQSDLEAHELIWRQARNPYLLKMLHSIIGPIFMFIASQTEFLSKQLARNATTPHGAGGCDLRWRGRSCSPEH